MVLVDIGSKLSIFVTGSWFYNQLSWACLLSMAVFILLVFFVFVFVCVCVCVRTCVWCSGYVLGSGPEVLSSSPTQTIFPSDFPSASYQPHQSTQLWLGTWHLLGCKFKAFSHETAMVQVGLRVPTPLAVRKGLFSCEFLAWLQELCLHGSQCLLSAQASWLCQVRITASICKRINICVCVCARVCVCVCVCVCVWCWHQNDFQN